LIQIQQRKEEGLSKEERNQDSCLRVGILTCATSMRYAKRTLLKEQILCSESLVGLESSAISILSIAQELSRGGFND
jgi:hypothetical protein